MFNLVIVPFHGRKYAAMKPCSKNIKIARDVQIFCKYFFFFGNFHCLSLCERRNNYSYGLDTSK